jgi:MFS family permease
VIGDGAHPAWRARAVGFYRLWRDGGFAVGAVLAGIVADLWGLRAAVWVVAALTAASGVIVAARMYETHPKPAPEAPRDCPPWTYRGSDLSRLQRHHTGRPRRH